MRYLFILFLACQQLGFAQQTLLIDTYGHYNSTGVKRQITDAFLYGGLIDSSHIQTTLSRLGTRNTFGLNMGMNAQWQTPWLLSKDANKWGSSYRLVIGAGVHQYGGIQFSKDLFGLVFQGGLPYLSDTLDLSGLKVEATTFTKIGFGLVNHLTQSSLLVHFVGVQNHLSAFMNAATWYQDASTAQIDLALNGQAQINASNTMAYGLALDLDYRFGSAEYDEAPQQFQLLVQNFGIARAKQTTEYSLDGALQYAGYSLAAWQQTSLDELATGFLDSLGYEKNSAQKWIFLPAQIQLAKVCDWERPNRIEAYYGAQFILRQTYIPFVYAGAHFKVKKAWQTGVGMAYGGFGGLRAQAYSAIRFKRSDRKSVV